VDALRLEVSEFRNLTRWRWLLTDAKGAFIADHEVRLNPAAAEYEAFRDLPGYLRSHVAPDQRAADEARIVGEVGTWIGAAMLGPVGSKLVELARHRPVTVQVIVPAAAAELLLRPLELAYVGGKPLAVQDVTLVMQVSTAADPRPAGDRLRVLGLFSMPDDRKALNLRRERQALATLVRGMAASGKAADVRVLQYGVTRDRLRDVLADSEGWDIVHVSGHGRPGELMLETSAGRLDLIDAAGLADLLDAARERVKLITLAACWSAASAADEQRRLLGLPSLDHNAAGDSAGTTSGSLAADLATRLGCAVLAMRYRVDDEFAMTLTGKVYELLAERGRPLPRAVGLALREMSRAESPFPALSVATPTLFGGLVAGLRLPAPKRTHLVSYDDAALKMAGFPDEPERFVGRTGVLARASAALATGSGVPGVLLHGMPGGGKTACALELAYGHEEGFDWLVWYKAPDEGMAVDGALADFALTLERYLPSFQVAHLVTSADGVADLQLRLTDLMKRRALIVIDNLESLLSANGAWRDDRWAAVIGALCEHPGLGRVILTSRRLPADSPVDLVVETVDALSADESLLLARELPHLTSLSRGKVPGLEGRVARRLARRALEAAQGHPKLLELADGQAAHPDRLATLVSAGEQTWRTRGGVPEGFFTDDRSATSPTDFTDVLARWAQDVAGTLSDTERDLFWLLACLEEGDRERPVLDDMWSDLWDRLGRAGPPPIMEQSLAAMTALGLAAARDQSGSRPAGYLIHPGIAAAAREQAGQSFRDIVDTTAGAAWAAAYVSAASPDGGGVQTGRAARAGLAAIPYLVRQRRWDIATALLNNAFNQDPSRANLIAVLPVVHTLTRHYPRAGGTLARIVQLADPAAGESYARSALDAAAGHGDFRAATAIAARMVALCLGTGRLAESLSFADQAANYTRQAGLGPWTQFADQARRLQVLVRMGHATEVLEKVTRLRAQMAALPPTADPSGKSEAMAPWAAREMLLDAGRAAASRLGRWSEALVLNDDLVASMTERDAPPPMIARSRQHDYFPLIQLGRANDAVAMLRDCLAVFRDASDTLAIGTALGSLADAESHRGHGDAALHLQGDALRYLYLASDVPGIAVGYHNYGDQLRAHARQPVSALAAHLAAALIHALAGSGDDEIRHSLNGAAADLRDLGTAGLPPDVAELCRQVGDIAGTDLAGLLARLSPDPATAEQALREIVARAVLSSAAANG
jgi:CHAT domain